MNLTKNRVQIVWRHNLHAYICDRQCGRSVLALKLTEAEQWALTHPCEGETQ